MTDYDSLIIGAGHNALTCAFYLARAGQRVLVLEAAAGPGGLARQREFAPGCYASAGGQWLDQLSAQVRRDMALEQHGLAWVAKDLATVSLQPSGAHRVVRGHHATGDGLSNSDQQQYAHFLQRLDKLAGALDAAWDKPPPKLVDANWGQRWQLAQLGLELKRLGRDDMRELLRIVTGNVYDLAQEAVGDAALQGLLAWEGVMGVRAGPRSPGTVFNLLYRRAGAHQGFAGPAQVAGGGAALGAAMAASAAAAGVELRYGTAVAAIDVSVDKVAGVTLASGEQLRASRVISSADPRSTFEHLLGLRHVEAGTARRVSQVRAEGVTGKLHLVLKGQPVFKHLDEELLGQRLVIAPDADYVERAFNPVKYGEWPAQPVLDIALPSLHDAQLVPAGQHLLTALVQYLPLRVEGGWERHRAEVLEAVLNVLEAYAPGLRELVLHAELLTPEDIAHQYHSRGGHWHQAEMSLDQVMMMRPFHGAAHYKTPVTGLYLCGAGSHPGGGLSGRAGHNAAQAILGEKS
jgi:phytoene dehydrogenase-like protein